MSDNQCFDNVLKILNDDYKTMESAELNLSRL